MPGNLSKKTIIIIIIINAFIKSPLSNDRWAITIEGLDLLKVPTETV